jgi:hypothetical protein
MKLQISRSKNSVSYYVGKSVRVNGVSTTVQIEKLGTYEEVLKRSGGEDPETWARRYVKELTEKEKAGHCEIMVKYSNSRRIPKGEQRLYNGGYLFLQKIYHALGLHRLCRKIAERHRFDFDLDAVLSRLLYCRILYPSSKLHTYGDARRFLENPTFGLQHLYRALDVIAEESDFIQSELYKNSSKTYGRNTGVLYYDCTNYFFETEQEEGLKRYGHSKEHRPSPIVQMGLFMDADGTPLAFGIQKGNTNEQTTLRPLEKKILSDFGLSKFVVCTDAGLSSAANRKFNDVGDRAFVTTQSVKNLKAFLKTWALDPAGWSLPGSAKRYDISAFGEKEETEHYGDVFYKERWIKEDGLEQRLLVTYSIKYRDYLSGIRDGQVARAKKMIDGGSPRLRKCSPNDPMRFIEKTPVTKDGEVADATIYGIDEGLVKDEQLYDGFYAVCTDIGGDPADIIRINRRRWQIEACFRIMKSDFKARPVYLQKDSRIEAHFMTCFLALVLYRLLEKQLGGDFTCEQILGCLRGMDFMQAGAEGYIPVYTRTDLTDRLHELFGFRTDYEIVPMADMKKIFRATKTKSV